MANIFIHTDHVCYVEETEFGTVIHVTSGEDVFVTQTFTEVVGAFDSAVFDGTISDRTNFCRFERAPDDDIPFVTGCCGSDPDFIDEGPHPICEP
jgi:hypothetical protein